MNFDLILYLPLLILFFFLIKRLSHCKMNKDLDIITLTLRMFPYLNMRTITISLG